jgi:hypothetical protein
MLRKAGFSEIEVLKDVDYVTTLAEAAPQEAGELLGRAGLTVDDVKGIVRSVTYRARR